jgi:dihydrofolate reductase
MNGRRDGGGIVQAAVSVSLDGFMAGVDGGAAGLHDWLTDGEVPSRLNPNFRMAPESVGFFDEGVARVGAVVAGRRTYDVSEGWGGRGPIPGLPLFVVTHRPPADPPRATPPYTYVSEGVDPAIARARRAAEGKDVHLMGGSIIRQAIRSGLLEELAISLVPLVLGEGVRLLDDLPPAWLEPVGVIDAPGVTHLTYRVAAGSGSPGEGNSQGVSA